MVSFLVIKSLGSVKSICFSLHRVATHSGNSEFRETQGILIYFLNLGKLKEVLIFSKKFREFLKFFKSQENFLLDL